MGFKCGIIGLPNVGKSTLFTALTKTATAQIANYPFCTIEPNNGEVAVPDNRMIEISKIAGSKEIIPTRINFVDIAGLVKGASKGEGLGNQFLANIREVDAIIHVLRCFVDIDIIHVEGRIDPVADAETVETELMLADLESLERRIPNLKKRANTKDKEALAILPLMERCLALLQEGKATRLLLKDLSEEEKQQLYQLNLLTSKPILYVCNVSEQDAAKGNEWTDQIQNLARQQEAEMIVISAAIEAELSQLKDEEALEYLQSIGLKEAGLNKLIKAGYHLLDLITYFTCGPKETRAWTIKRGTKAPQAAGVIHSDFERGFIRAQTIGYQDYLTYKGETGAKEAGRARDEGKDYVVEDGDVILFRHNT